ncbi:hypothetical protein [[Enterobacter] lignolyticus]|uniref:Uncharacterized protein n=1 Tax=Enterobacter lignolyticus (strain SCF1) TaxID=701347 RepID=E3GBA3_ENTLS|nr:hypothetical protein [[Enterobacter] lignolyticus]ADO47772.1 hypothetical protein Entcl_1511 [[Enterobacter] lignolyticus SCF1]
MKNIILVLIAAVSFSANAMSVSKANKAVVHAERRYSSALANYEKEAVTLGSGVVASDAEKNLNAAAVRRAQAYSDLRSAEMVQANSQATRSSINVAASTLNPSTKVKTNQGIVTAGSLPGSTQVAVAYDSAFHRTVKHGGNNHDVNGSANHHSGNGSDNAHASAFHDHSGYGGGFHY